MQHEPIIHSNAAVAHTVWKSRLSSIVKNNLNYHSNNIQIEGEKKQEEKKIITNLT